MSKIAIIGASYLQLPAVKKAKEMGHEVICFAWPEGAVCRDHADRFYPVSITDKEEILRVCRQESVDGITTVASDLAVRTVNYVASNMGLISNPYDWTDATTDKYKMRECFKNNNIPSPRYNIVGANSETGDLMLDFPVIVKPTDRSGSRGIYKVEKQSELKAAIETARKESFSGDVLIEEFVDGREISVESISFRGRHYIIQITDKVTTGAPHFVELEHHQPSTLDQKTQDKVRETVRKALDALHIQFGASHSELKISPEKGVRVIEIGARGGGDFIASNLVELSTGYDFMKAIIDVSLGKFEYPIIKESSYSGVYFLSKETERLMPVIKEPRKYPQIVKAEIIDSNLRELSCSGDRSGFLIYKDNKRFIPDEEA